MGPDALSALDQLATGYIKHSKAKNATVQVLPQEIHLDISREYSSTLQCVITVLAQAGC